MTDHQIRELLTDAVSEVEPRYALDELRARTATKRRWPYAAGGAVLAVAASVAAFAVLGPDQAPRAIDPGSSTAPSVSPSPTASVTENPSKTVAVYYVGDTPDGPRLYREFQPPAPSVEEALKFGVEAALSTTPKDADYRTMWPRTGTELRNVEVVDDVIRIELSESATATHGLVGYERRAAIEQLIYTAQAAVQERLPVQFLVNGNPAALILGLPASEPLANGPVLDTLAHVSLTTPSSGAVVDNDEPLVVEGVGNSFEGNIVTRLETWEGAPVTDQEPAIAGWGEGKLFPFEVTLDLTNVPPGNYEVVSRTDDPSGRGLFHVEGKGITVVD